MFCLQLFSLGRNYLSMAGVDEGIAIGVELEKFPLREAIEIEDVVVTIRRIEIGESQGLSLLETLINLQAAMLHHHHELHVGVLAEGLHTELGF